MKKPSITQHPSSITSYLCTLLFGVAVFLFFGLAYPHHLHYQEQFQLFLFDSTYVWEIIRLPGGVADLLGRFCTQFFLYAWVGAFIIALLLMAVQLLTFRLFKVLSSRVWRCEQSSMVNGQWFYGLSFIPSFLLWLFLLDEHALLGGVWAVLLTQLAVWGLMGTVLRVVGTVLRVHTSVHTRTVPFVLSFVLLVFVTFFVLNWVAFGGSHYYRYPTVFPTLLYVAWASAVIIPFLVCMVGTVLRRLHKGDGSGVHTGVHAQNRPHYASGWRQQIIHFSLFAITFIIMMIFVWQNANFKAEKVMQYDFMARHQQWNRIIQTINDEKPNNQIGVTVQNLALAMHGQLVNHLSDYTQNGIAGLLPDVQSDATSPLPTAEAFYQLGMIYVAQRTVFEAQEAILDFQKSARCYKRLAQTNLIIGSYEVARKYLAALQKTLFYRDWADETLLLLGNEDAIAKHPEYGRLRQCAYNNDFYFSDHVTPEMLESLYHSNPDNHLALQYLIAYYMLTGDREGYAKLMEEMRSKREDV